MGPCQSLSRLGLSGASCIQEGGEVIQDSASKQYWEENKTVAVDRKLWDRFAEFAYGNGHAAKGVLEHLIREFLRTHKIEVPVQPRRPPRRARGSPVKV